MLWDLSVPSCPVWDGQGLRCCQSRSFQLLLRVLPTAPSGECVSGVASAVWKFFFFPKLVRENTSLVWGLTLAARRCREGHFRVCRLSNCGVSLSGGILLCPDKLGTGTSTGPGIVLLSEGQEPAASI